VRRQPHENVATVLVDPCALPDLELELMTLDLWVWPVATAPICIDGGRTAFQLRRQMLARERGAWDVAEAWTPVWISFGPTWRTGAEPLPWSAHRVLWDVLDQHADRVRFKRRLGGVRPLRVPADLQL
jgi:hypothetical protein